MRRSLLLVSLASASSTACVGRVLRCVPHSRSRALSLAAAAQSEEIAAAKTELRSSLSSLRRAPSPAARRDVLAAVAGLGMWRCNLMHNAPIVSPPTRTQRSSDRIAPAQRPAMALCPSRQTGAGRSCSAHVRAPSLALIHNWRRAQRTAYLPCAAADVQLLTVRVVCAAVPPDAQSWPQKLVASRRPSLWCSR